MNEVQKIQLERIRLCQYNEFDGPIIARDLEDNAKLWKSFVFGRFKYNQLIELRDLSDGYINADTLYILTTKNHVRAIQKLAKKWKVDEVGYHDAKKDHGCVAFRTGTFATVGTGGDSFWQAYGAGLGADEVVFRLWWD